MLYRGNCMRRRVILIRFDRRLFVLGQMYRSITRESLLSFRRNAASSASLGLRIVRVTIRVRTSFGAPRVLSRQNLKHSV